VLTTKTAPSSSLLKMGMGGVACLQQLSCCVNIQGSDGCNVTACPPMLSTSVAVPQVAKASAHLTIHYM
jgi:hypothetical protein